jgi:hypothetical protein
MSDNFNPPLHFNHVGQLKKSPYEQIFLLDNNALLRVNNKGLIQLTPVENPENNFELG